MATTNGSGAVRPTARPQLSRPDVAKLAAQLPCRKDTIAMAALSLGRVEELGPDLAGEVVDEQVGVSRSAIAKGLREMLARVEGRNG
jgi:hypothetical protein